MCLACLIGHASESRVLIRRRPLSYRDIGLRLASLVSLWSGVRLVTLLHRILRLPFLLSHPRLPCLLLARNDIKCTGNRLPVL